MVRRHTPFLILLLTCVLFGKGMSQFNKGVAEGGEDDSHWIVSVNAGLDFLFHGGGIRTTDGTYFCCVYNRGSGTDGAVGIGLWIPVPPWLYLAPRIEYANIGGRFRTEGTYPILGANDHLESVRVEEMLQMSLPVLSVEGRVVYTMEEGFFCYISPLLTWVISRHTASTLTILDSPELAFSSGERSKSVDARVENLRTTLVAMAAGFGWRLQLDERLHLLPQLTYRSYLTRLTGEGAGTLSSIGGRVELRYSVK